MECGMEGFSDAEFDLLGMLFSGDEPDYPNKLLSQYLMVDHDGLGRRPDFEMPVADAGVNMAGFDEGLYYVDPSFQWDGSFCTPTTHVNDVVNDFSTVVHSERIHNDIVMENMTVDTEVWTANDIPTVVNIVDEKRLKHKRKSNSKRADADVEIPETPKKRPRRSRDTKKRQENVQTKSNQKLSDIVVDKEGNNNDGNANNSNGHNRGRQEGQSPSSCSSEDDINSQQLSASDDFRTSSSTLTNNTEVKPRASRGAATDPQSLYARKRRERINERLRILQTLIPNGTKVDISTMLEEAVHYVKFLQLQIKLLSSDDLWMYAPIAYNGKDIGLSQIFSSHL